MPKRVKRVPGKPKEMKPLNSSKHSYKQPLQHNVEVAIKPPKIVEKDIFDMMGASKNKNKKTKKR